MTTYRFRTMVTKDSGDEESLADRTFTDLTITLDKKHVINNDTKVLWALDADGDPFSSGFSCLAIVSDQPVELELTAKDGDADEELSHFTLAANVPFLLGDDAANYNYTTDAFAGTADSVTKIRCKNASAVDATVRTILGYGA